MPATPGPFKFVSGRERMLVTRDEVTVVATAVRGITPLNAEFMLSAMNAHEAMLEALRGIIAYWDMGGIDGPQANPAGFADYIARARSAIAKAE